MTPLVVCSLIIIVTLTVSGIAKALEPTSTVTSIINLKLDRWLPVKPIAKTLPWAEIALAAALLFLPGALQILAATAAVLLFAAYFAVIGRAVVQGNTASCNCFGSASGAPVSMFTLIRNTALLMASCGALIGAISTGRSALGMLLATDAEGWLWLIGTALASLTLWALYRAELVPAAPAEEPAATAEPATDEEGDYLRLPIPFASLRYPAAEGQEPNAGTEVTLRELAAQQARVLLWVSPGCGHCHQVIENVEHWQQQLPMLKVHPVVSDESAIKQFDFSADIQPFVDINFNTEILFGSGTPSAVALGTDGLLAGGPVSGGSAVIDFVNDIVEEINASYHEHQEPPAEQVADQ